MIYGFAFTKRNISSYTLYNLTGLDHRNLLWGTTSIDQYCQLLLHDKPEYILGLGVYSGRDKTKVRIEQFCSNIFKSKTIDNLEEKQIPINYFVQPGEFSKYTSDIRTSYCNYVSFQIMSLINTHQLPSKYTFLHIPKSLNSSIVITEINQMLSQSVLKFK